MCRTCLNESNSNLISIYSDVTTDHDEISIKNEKDRQIAKILDELTDNRYVCILCLVWQYFVNILIVGFVCISGFRMRMNSHIPTKYVQFA